MARINLNVSFAQKEEAKALGARWDAVQKVWYVPDGVDYAPFAMWLDMETEGGSDHNLRASSYYIAEGARECWKCKKTSKVFAFILPSGFQEMFYDEDIERECWEVHGQASIISYITRLPDNAQQAIKPITNKYYVSFSRTIGSEYWANHCECCNALLGDNETLEEFGSPFQPLNPEQAQKIFLRQYAEDFKGYGQCSMYDDSMRYL